MNAEQKRLAREIFADALEKDDVRERAAWVAHACGADAELRELVEALLQAHEQGGESPGQALLAAFDQPLDEVPGTRIGRYKLLEQIGEGGFGVVFMAEQTDPVHRKVALKIIKAGMDTREVIARFEAERQALALMDHPNIAKVFDGGVTGDRESQIPNLESPIHAGRPYFVMELVKGIPLTDYCDVYHLSTHDRLQLFLQVCQAVQHAHQKGIIHRDLKPSNILVTEIDGKAVPKIIDFGVAKALGQRLTEHTLFTAFAQMVGTPAYMSPEQAALSGVDIDTRSDIYALGVLLYELLTGVTPFDRDTLHQAALEEIRRLIREVEPPKPSTRLRTLGDKLTAVAQQRQTEPGTLTRLVHGDLDWIVMKCLEKDRARRYETASALAEDLRHHLNHEPVKAGPPSRLYRAGKFVRRHRMGVALAASVTVALVAGLIASLIGFREARLERDHAVAAEQQAEAERDRAVMAEAEAEKQQARAEDLARQEAKQRQRAEQTLMRMEILRARELFDRGEARAGLATLAMLVRQHPADLALTEWLLNRLTQRSFPLPTLTPLLHRDEVVSARFDPAGRRILTVGKDSAARLWDARSGQPSFAPLQHGVDAGGRHRFSGGLFPLFAVWSPKGLRVATGASDNTARVWDAQTGQPLTPPLMHSNWVTAVAFSPNGDWLATGCKDGSVRFWNATNGQPRDITFRHLDWVNYIVFSPDGKRVLTGADDRTARVWELASGRPVGQPLTHEGEVKCGAFSFDGRRILTASADHTARLWDAESGKPLSPPLRHEGIVVTASFSPDATRLVTASFDRTARLWDGFTGQPQATPLRHKGQVRSARFSPEGERVVTASEDGTARVWDAKTGEPLCEPMPHRGVVWYAEFSPDGRRVVTASADRHVQVWDVQAGQALHHWFEDAAGMRQALWRPDGQSVLGVSSTLRIWDSNSASNLFAPDYRAKPLSLTGSFSPDGRLLATTSDDAAVLVWSVERGALATPPIRHLAQVRSVQFSPDGLRLLSASEDGTARIWNAQTGQPVGPPLAHPKAVLCARFSPTGQQVLTAGDDAQAKTWDAQTGQPAGPVLSHPDSVSFAAFSPDGRRVLTVCADHAVRVWEPVSGRMRGTPIRHLAPIHSASFSPDGRWIVTASEDKTARVWDADTGVPVSEPLSHAALVATVEFSPDGRWVLTASHDGTARLWDVATALPVSPPFRHSSRLSSTRISPDGIRILTASFDRTARIWEVVRAEAPAPAWLPDLAEAIAGERVGTQGSLEGVSASSYSELKRKLRELPDRETYAQWAKWFCADRASRPVAPSPSPNRNEFVAQLAAKFRAKPDLPSAQENLREALQLDPLNPSVYCAWADHLLASPNALSTRQLAQLDWQIQRIAALSPGQYDAGGRRARYRSLAGDPDGALALMDAAARPLNGPLPTSYWSQRADLLERAGRLEESLNAHNRAVEAEATAAQDAPAFSPARYGRYRFLCRQKRYVEAQADWLSLMRVPRRDPRTPAELVDLSSSYNATLGECWLLHELYRANLSALPTGIVRLDGVAFDVRGIIQLRGPYAGWADIRQIPFPGSIPLGRPGRRLHFLHAADRRDAPGTHIGEYVVHFAGGPTERIPVIYGKDVCAWLREAPEPDTSVPAWQSSWLPGVTLQLHHTVWTNSQPDCRIERVDFTASPSARAAPFLVALTVEP